MGAEKKSSSATPVGQVLPQCLAQLGVAAKLNRNRIAAVWPRVVGDTIAGYTRTGEFNAGRLQVTVTEPSWLKALMPLEKEIRDKLNRRLGTDIIQHIHFIAKPSRTRY